VFNFTGGEFLILLVVALIVLGPDKLPEAARRLGGFLREARQMSSGFKQELEDAIGEPARDMRSTFTEPMQELRRTVQGPLDELKQSLSAPLDTPAAAAAAATAAAEAGREIEAATAEAAAATPAAATPAAADVSEPSESPAPPESPTAVVDAEPHGAHLVEAPPAPGRQPPTRRPAPPVALEDDDGLLDLLDLPVAADDPGLG
jgi:sec-independent protein translocase protein TatB